MARKLISGLVVFMLLFTISPSVKALAKPDNFDNWAKAAINWGKASIGERYYDSEYTYCLRHTCACFRLRDSHKMVDNTGSGYYYAKDLEDELKAQNKVYNKEYDGWKNAPPGSMLFFRKMHDLGHIVLYLGNGKIIDGGLREPVKEVDINSGSYRKNYSGWAYPIENWRPSSEKIDKWANTNSNPSQNINACSIEVARYQTLDESRYENVLQFILDYFNKDEFVNISFNNGSIIFKDKNGNFKSEFKDPFTGIKKKLTLHYKDSNNQKYVNEFSEKEVINLTKTCKTNPDNCNLPAPYNLSPNNGTEVSVGTRLTWSKVDKKDNNYTLEFYNSNHNPHGDKKFPQGEDFTIQNDQNFSNNQKYYWRVAANCSGNKASENFSEERWFIFKEKTNEGNNCKAPELYYPLNHSTFSKPFTFKWEIVKDVSKYQLSIYNDEKSLVESFETSLTDGHSAYFTISDSLLLPNKKYYWEVASMCNNRKLEYSILQDFTVKEDQPLPKAPELLKPKDKAVYDLNVTFWSAIRGMSAKYPDNEDRSNISFRFELEIIEKGIYDSSSWQKDWQSNNMQEWLSPKAKDIFNQLMNTDPLPNVDLTFKWRVTAKNDKTGKEASSNYWTFRLYNKVTCNAPRLLRPENGETITLPYTFRWESALGAKYYRLNLFNENGNLVDRYNDTSQTSYYISSLSAGKSYYWSVTSICEDGNEKESGKVYFTVKKDDTCSLPAPILQSPSDRYEVSLPFQLRWESVANRKSYKLRIYGPNHNLLFEKTTDTESYSFDSIGSFNYGYGQYFWSVATNCSNGVAGRESEKRSFIIIEMKKPSKSPTLVYPPENSTDIPVNVTLKWEAYDGTFITYWIHVSGKLSNGGKHYFYGNKPSEHFKQNYITLPDNLLLPGEKYHWSVYATHNNNDNSTFYSYPFWYFTTIKEGSSSCDVPTPIEPSGRISTTQPRFDWYTVKNVEYYQLELDGEVVTIKDRNGNALNPPVRFSGNFEEGRHSWRVRSVCKNGTSSWSQALYFTVDSGQGGGDNLKPTLLEPKNNATDVSTKPTFKWTKTSDPYYCVYVYDDDGNRVFDSGAITTTSVKISDNGSLYGGSTYKWVLFYRDANGEWATAGANAFRTEGFRTWTTASSFYAQILHTIHTNINNFTRDKASGAEFYRLQIYDENQRKIPAYSSKSHYWSAAPMYNNIEKYYFSVNDRFSMRRYISTPRLIKIGWNR
jgi:hypothetical protein